ncbi:MAG: hypothetical protein J6I72_01720 [Muribaculaceae bacterium]|nr:hypothetical protein [Muribaculaceae bacterium]
MILIFTNKEDVHPTPVIEILNKRGTRVFRFNTECLLTDYEFSWWNNSNNCDFVIKNVHSGLTVKGSEITSIWDRRPEPPKELLINSSEEVNKLNLNEAAGFLSFIRYYLKDVFSIGNIVNDRYASSKMLQIRIAQQVGFEVPSSCFSNKKQDMIDFAKKYRELILKPIDGFSNISDNENAYVFYTKKLASDSLMGIPDDAFSQTVSFLQNYVEKAYEVRVTVVGRKVFACKIDSQVMQEDQGKIDWRQGYDYNIKHESIQLPKEIENKCIAFLKEMGLNFGAFDYIVTPENKYVFLECNPNGQWLWIELLTGQQISKAIADALENCEGCT